jgi:hypothetical protein
MRLSDFGNSFLHNCCTFLQKCNAFPKVERPIRCRPNVLRARARRSEPKWKRTDQMGPPERISGPVRDIIHQHGRFKPVQNGIAKGRC